MKVTSFPLMLLMVVLLLNACKKDDNSVIVKTLEVTNIGSHSATLNGEVESDEAPVTGWGFFWSETNSNPSEDDEILIIGNLTGNFSAELTGLDPETKYYVRAYASNIKGTAYGVQLSFQTLNAQQANLFTDQRDGNIYKTVTIGNQIWMAENLKYLPNVVGSATGSETTPHHYVSDYNGTLVSEAKTTANYNTYGVLYNWMAAKAACPNGWKLPSDAEWTELTDFLGGERSAGRKLKEEGIAHWRDPNQGATNETGFTALPGGERRWNGMFLHLGIYGNWWSRTESSTYSAWSRFIDSYNIFVLSYESDKDQGYSVRCIKGESPQASTPSVTTSEIINITTTTAISGGNVIDDGGASITARGVCWNTTGSPTITDSKTNDDDSADSWESELVDLNPNLTYYVRAYATNIEGTAYGQQIEFITISTGGKDVQTAVVDVTNPATGRIWMDRNLGAKRAAISSTDSEAYGDLYQWGRAADGHQKRNSPTTSIRSNSDTPGHGDFISAFGNPPDWRNQPNTDLWQDVEGVNNPCPNGYRLPSSAEWYLEQLSWSSKNADGAFASPLKLTMAGIRGGDYGTLGYVGSYGNYWSSTVSGIESRYLEFLSNTARSNVFYRSEGMSVRCIKDAEIQANLPTINTTSITSITHTTATSGGNVTSHGEASVTRRGVCWNTTGNPTIADNKTTNGLGSGSFNSNITGLHPNTTYFLRAYATNSVGTAYGQEIEFNTEVMDWQRDTQTAVVDVTNPATGKTWMDRNLGASRAAISGTDEEAYGDLYQWGRAADGHQKRNSPVTSIQSNTYTPGHGSFIVYDWQSWQITEPWQDVGGINNPCPSGYRLPTEVEWEVERQSWDSNNAAGAFVSLLKLPMAGYRSRNEGALDYVSSSGYYWSSYVSGNPWFLLFNNKNSGIDYSKRAHGKSVRCIKD